MLVPLSWLREFTPYEGDAQTLGDRLTMLGLELEGIINPFAAIEGIMTGQVVSCEMHPNSDHLHCCKVDMGRDEILDIVCGAPNVALGQKVAVAPVGSRLPDGTVIKKAKLRGQPSCGMICSERELGLSEDHSGILVLPECVDIGVKLVDALEMDREVLDISVTPNRADCLSIIGMARETASAFNLPFNIPELPLIEDCKAPVIDVPIQIDDPDLCYLYSGRVISNIKMGPAPMRMRYRLIAVGVRPISNIVDVTNYILFECGQPLHSFDLDKLAGGRIIVRRAGEGEKFTTLDGKERTLCARDLCICDAEKPVGLAGVMGGLNTEISAESKNVFLESAVFNPSCIRVTSRRLGLSSEASYRFERGVDQMRTIWSLDRAIALMASISGGTVNRSFACSEPRPFRPARISYRPKSDCDLLGVAIADDFQRSTLESLGCAVEDNDDGSWTVVQPSWRHDLLRTADLIEETGRMYGMDSIPPKLPEMHRVPEECIFELSRFGFWSLLRGWGSGLGLNEAINYSFVGQSDLDFLNLQKEKRIAIFNPLSEDQNVLRTCLAPGLLHDLANNLAFGAQSVKLFELANVFAADPESETGAKETGLLGIMLYGMRHDSGWPWSDALFDYASIKGIVENLLQFLHVSNAIFRQRSEHPYLAPCVQIFAGDEYLGDMGRVMPQIADSYNAQKEVWLCELNIDRLKNLHDRARRSFKPLPVYPSVRRDITVMAARNIHADDILENILAQKLSLLEGAVLVDCFEPEGLDERNLTFRLTFRHPERTLKDEEADREREKIAETLRQKLGVRI